MESSLDMNGNNILNAGEVAVSKLTVNGLPLGEASVQEAFNWAQYPEDQPVPEGNGAQYSAFHYSQKAKEAEVAADLALYNFNGTWYGSLASEPTVDPNGNAPTAGDIYLNSTNGIVYFYQGGIWNPLGGGNVTSIFGRTGAVVASAGDYTATQVTYSNTASGLTATTVQAAVDEVQATFADYYTKTEIDTEYDSIAADIKSGAFNPSAPTSVWTGSSATGVATSALSEQGLGMYVLVDPAGEAYPVCVVSMSLDSASGIRFFNPSGVARDGAFRMTDNTFHIYEYNSDTGAFIQEIAITEIFKV